MKTFYIKRYFTGFALLEVFLAVAILSIIAFGTYSIIAKSRSVSSMQLVMTDITNIALAFSPLQTSFASDSSLSASIDSQGGLSTSFLNRVPIPSTRLTQSTVGFSFVKTGLSVSGVSSKAGFSMIMDTSTNIKYFVIGFKVNQGQLAQFIQNANANFGVFYNNSGGGLKSSTSASSIPSCSSASSCSYTLYFVTPKTEDVSKFGTDFSAP